MVHLDLGAPALCSDGTFGDVISTVSGEYNYLSPSLWPYIDPMQILHKFMALSPMAIAYGLLNGFYEEFFFWA